MAWVLGAAGAALGCGGGTPATQDAAPEAMLRIQADSDLTPIKPGETAQVQFRLLDERGAPVPDRVMQFAIVDDPTTMADDPRGATLAFNRAVTRADGRVSLEVMAGPQEAAFTVRANSPRATSLDVTVVVDTATFAPAEVVPVLVDPSPGVEITTVRLHLLDGGACFGVRYENLPNSRYQPRTVPADTSVLYPSINTEDSHAVVGLAINAAGQVRGGGCVDLPGTALVLLDPVRVILPMRIFRASPEGTFNVTSHLHFRPALRAATTLADAWKELSECPMDPSRLWLDCTVDALRTDRMTDPLDCRPADDEGPLGLKLAMRRGVRLPTPATGRCRDRIDSAGRPSLEMLVDGLFPAGRPGVLGALPPLAAEARQLLDALKIHSVLIIRRSSAADRYLVDHTLVAAEFPAAAEATVIDLRPLGVPVLDARFVTGTARLDELHIANHGFTLRLGSAARAAFARASLRPRGLTGEGAAAIPALVSGLYGLASRVDRGAPLTGCAALDSLVCADVGESRGCLMTACSEGTEALARRLDEGFDALDGDDVDLLLGGSAAILDPNNDRRADSLGMLNVPTSPPGLWSGEVRARDGNSAFTGVWAGQRRTP